MDLPRLVVTGASGFVGRHLLEALKAKYKIFAIARRTQRQSGAPVHPNISWLRVDIGDIEPLETVFRKIRDTGGADILVHLAAYYDFSGVEHPEYMRTNVQGLRNVLDLSKSLHLKQFIFASSTAACRFPAPGKVLNEESPPDGDHIYARTKRIGEAMLNEYKENIPSCVVRFAALYSDWCEYPPLYMFVGSWLSDTWTSNVLAGKGNSSVPYLHIRDVVSLLKILIERGEEIKHGEVFIASPDGSTTHHQLFEAATLAFYGQRKKPVYLPKVLCRPGIWMRKVLGNFTGHRPFEDPWMCRYIDLQMNMDAARTRKRLDWNPRSRLEIIRRIPFIIENFRAEPAEWHHRNTAALKEMPLVLHLKIFQLMKSHETELEQALSRHILGPEGAERFAAYQQLPLEQQQWSKRQLIQQLMASIRARDKSLFRSFCFDIAELRFEQGFSLKEICDALEVLNKICLEILGADPASKKLPKTALKDYITMTIQFGIDEIQEVFEQWGIVDYQPQLLDS